MLDHRKTKFQHQKDFNGCGVACLAGLLGRSYDQVKRDFEKKFYTTEKVVLVHDIVKYLEFHDLEYRSKFFNRNKENKAVKKEAELFSKIEGSITLIVKSQRYPLGHYLLRVKGGWVDPWYNMPRIDNVQAGLRRRLPDAPWYVIYPIAKEPG